METHELTVHEKINIRSYYTNLIGRNDIYKNGHNNEEIAKQEYRACFWYHDRIRGVKKGKDNLTTYK